MKQKIRVGKCDYVCDSKDLGPGRGRGFRVYCRRDDRKCKPGVGAVKPGGLPKSKEIWRLTKEEYLAPFEDAYNKEFAKGSAWKMDSEARKKRLAKLRADILIETRRHEEAVSQALEQELPVPDNVLKDYPELSNARKASTFGG